MGRGWKIAQSSCGVHKGKNRTIQNQLDKIALFVFGLDCFSMILASLFNIFDWDMDFDDYVSISFGSIPQALALTTTLCLTIVARRLDSRKKKKIFLILEKKIYFEAVKIKNHKKPIEKFLYNGYNSQS